MVLGDRSLGRPPFDARTGFVALILGGLGLLFAQKWTYFGLSGPRVPVLTPDETWLAYHLLVEALAVVLVFVGLFGLQGYVRNAGRIERAGYVLTVVSCALLVPTHAAEHLAGGYVFSATLVFGSFGSVPVVFDPGGMAYYLNWIAFGSGVFVFGALAWWRGVLSTTTAALLVVLLPVGVVGGLLAVLTGTYPFLGVHRLAHGTVWVAVGYRFFVRTTESTVTDDRGVASGSDR